MKKKNVLALVCAALLFISKANGKVNLCVMIFNHMKTK